jgi:hypothetical protein
MVGSDLLKNAAKLFARPPAGAWKIGVTSQRLATEKGLAIVAKRRRVSNKGIARSL